jgi:phosphohistidine phosphatase
MKRLLLLRHAKTEQVNKDTPADAERQLTERGRNDAPMVGRALREKGYKPDLILCSPSMRTRQTLELTNAELQSSAKIEFVEAIYAAGAQKLLALFRGIPDSAASAMVVGHNPGFEDCAALLVDEKRSKLEKTGSGGEKFPTSAVAVLDFDIQHWKELVAHSGSLIDFIRPKDLKG